MYIILVLLAVGFGFLVFFNYQANTQQMAEIQAAEEAAQVTPTPAPTATPEPTPTPERSVETITLAFAGDLVGQSGLTTDAQHTETGEDGTETVAYDYTEQIAGVIPSLEGADLAACTLVASLTDDGSYDAYRMPAAMASALSDTGFRLVNVATDHLLDYGLDGLVSTVDILREENISALGAYSDDSSRTLPMAEVNGVKVAFLSYTYSTASGTGSSQPVSIADNKWCLDLLTSDYMTEMETVDYEKIDADIAAVKEAGADVIVCFVYWWDNTQYYTSPRDNQEEVADYLCQNGVDIVIGGGVKSPQPIEVRTVEREGGNANCVVCYSLSNLMSCFTDNYTNISAVARIEISRDVDSGEVWISGVDACPLFMQYTDKDEPGGRYMLLDARNALDDYENGAGDAVSQETYEAIQTGIADLETLMGEAYFQEDGLALDFPYEAASE